MNHKSTKIDHSFIDKHEGSLFTSYKINQACRLPIASPVPPNTGESANQNHFP